MADAIPGSSGGAGGQVLYGLIVIAILFISLFTMETLYSTATSSQMRFRHLIDYTAGAEDMTLVVHQDITKHMDAIPIGLSVNERTGIEFAYSFFLYVYPATFSGDATLKHVFHKGFGCPWPLMGPGVFIKGDTNTMRVFMNTYRNPYTYADIKNIPVQKWFHVVLNCYKGGLDIFINGSLANRISFEGTLPYQNFGDLYIFSNAHYNSFRGSCIPAIGGGSGSDDCNAAVNGEDFLIDGTFKGYLSNLIYARYALSVGEIQTLMNAGPSSKKREKRLDTPPYLADDWWASQGQR